MNNPALHAQYEDHMGDDLSIVNAAKVSFGRRSEFMTGRDERLLNYLARGMTQGGWENLLESVYMREDMDELAVILNKYRDTPLHKSPFNHAFLRFHVKAPVFVARQLVKHEYLVWNEISGRYVEFDLSSIYLPEVLRSKAEDKKQGSGKPIDDQDEALEIISCASEDAFNAYDSLLERGVCEEQARMVLPLNLVTEWIWSGSLGAFAKMCKLRLAPDAQEESRKIAQQISDQIAPHFPVAWKALMTNGCGE